MARQEDDDYIDVAQRVQDFKDEHPNGSLQTIGWEIVEAHGYHRKNSEDMTQTYVVYRAAAYRHADDPRPGMGIAWEPWPGQTPYTAHSELMNAETAAWGRAIVALGLTANKKLASRVEVRNRVAEQADAVASPATDNPSRPAAPRVPKLMPAERKELQDLYIASGWDVSTLCMQLVLCGAIPDKAASALGDHPADADYATLVGPATKALTPNQFAAVKAALADAAAERTKAAA